MRESAPEEDLLKNQSLYLPKSYSASLWPVNQSHTRLYVTYIFFVFFLEREFHIFLYKMKKIMWKCAVCYVI